MKKTKITTRIICTLLSLLLLFYTIPSTVYGEIASLSEAGNNKAAEPQDENESSLLYGEKKSFEVEDMREENVKVFRLEDGSYISAVYPTSVHFEDESGEWENIDNTLKSNNSEISTKDTRVKFAKKITGSEEIFTLKEGNTKITFALRGAIKKTAGEIVALDTEEESLDELSKMLTLNNLSSRIIYRGVLPGIDIEYLVNGRSIKENIIVNERKDSYSYTFDLSLNNLAPALSADGSVEIRDNSGEIKYVIPAPVVYDANGVYAESDQAHLELAKTGSGKYALTVSVSSEWMNSEDRAFPITVDPAIKNNRTQDMTELLIDANWDDYTSEAIYGESIYSLMDGDIMYWRLNNFPSIPKSSYISEATWYFSAEVVEGGYYTISLVSSDWDMTLTLEQIENYEAGGYGKTQDRLHMFGEEVGTTKNCQANITDAVCTWAKNPESNYGIMCFADDADFNVFSINSTDSTKKPFMTITFREMSGVEDYWTLSTHSVGTAGVGSINLANGNLFFDIPLLSTTDSLIPYTVSLMYNSYLSGLPYSSNNVLCAYEESHTPYGYKLSVQESVVRKTMPNQDGNSMSYFVWNDSDGTSHYFLPAKDEDGTIISNKFVDEDGLKLELNVNYGANEVYITDINKTVRTFVGVSSGGYQWYLKTITDKYGNSVVFSHDTHMRVVEIGIKPYGLNTISMLKLLYTDSSASGFPYLVMNETTDEAIILRYSSSPSSAISSTAPKYLREAIYAKGTVSTTESNWHSFYNSPTANVGITVISKSSYNYNNSGYLTETIDITTGYKVVYQWIRGKVFSCTEYAETVKGQEIRCSYETGYSSMRSSGSDDIYQNKDDIFNVYIFDKEGRVISSYSHDTEYNILGAVSGKYEEQENARNSIKESAVIGGNPTNYLLNGGLEKITNGNFQHWESADSSNVDFSAFGDDHYFAVFNNAQYQPSSMYQTVLLPAGDYTFSVELQTSVTEGMNICLEAISQSGASQSVSEWAPSKSDSNLSYDGKFVACINFTVNGNNNSGKDTFKIGIRISYEDYTEGFVYADNFVLRDSSDVGKLNIVDYGGFDAFSADANVDLQTVWTDKQYNTNFVTIDDMGTVVRIGGFLDIPSYVKQNIYTAPDTVLSNYTLDNQVPQNANNTYIVSGFAKAAKSVKNDNAIFALRVDVKYLIYQNGSPVYIINTHYLPFLSYVEERQFVSGTFSTDGAVDENGNNLGGCVVSIDLFCEFSYQEDEAYFDNISVIKVTDQSVTKNSYYENGLLKSSSNLFYTEYYEYNASKDLTRVADSRGYIYDYNYDIANNFLSNVTYYTYINRNGTYIYPIDSIYPDSELVLTPKNRTLYNYNAYGQCTRSSIFEVEYSSDGITIIPKSGTKYLITETTYIISQNSKIFGAVDTYIDENGITTKFFYDTSDGKLLAILNPVQCTGVSYTYDDKGRLIMVRPASYYPSSFEYGTIADEESVSYAYNSENLLSSITTASTTYTFTYDAFGNSDVIKAGSFTLADYTYNQNNGKLSSITYGNGDVVSYVYDELENLKEIWYNGVKNYEYTYSETGQIHTIHNVTEGKKTLYNYDFNDRLTSVIEQTTSADANNLASYNIIYDLQGRVGMEHQRIVYNYDLMASEKIGNLLTYSYNYNDEGNLYRTETKIGTDHRGDVNYLYVRYYYDAFDRTTQKNVYFATDEVGFKNTITYGYDANGTNTMPRVETYISDIETGAITEFYYSYDNTGNITEITTGAKTYRYHYDDIGQLVREDNSKRNQTYVYEYDNAGNIIAKKSYSYTVADNPTGLLSTTTFGYTSSSWGDLMTSYNGREITYDSMGNPLTYYNGMSYTFGWTGRLLTSATCGYVNISFTYNSDGMRTSKTVGSVTTYYFWEGTRLIGEKTGDDVYMYMYDAEGSPIGFKYSNTLYDHRYFTSYFYEKNLQGDIIGVYDQDGTLLISYEYSAWGLCYTKEHNGGYSTEAYNNPFRYRGYYREKELDLYYLGSRYYDPYVGRFISPDAVYYLGANGDLVGYNLYSYCSNNPVMYVDPSGSLPVSLMLILAGALMGALFGGLVDAGTQLHNNEAHKALDFGSIANSTITGAAFGMSTALGVGYLGPMIAGSATFSTGSVISAFFFSVGISALAGGGGYVAQEIVNKRGDELNCVNVIGNAGVASLEGAYSFGVGGMVGSMNPTIGKNGAPLISKEWYMKFIITQEFSNAVRIPLNKLRKSIWG